jgi:hypothetical protein
MINIAGSKETYDRAFGTQLVAEERITLKERGREDPATFIFSADTGPSGHIQTAGTRFEDVLEGVALEEPRYFMAASAFPPPKTYWHLDVPADVSLGCNADLAHRAGITGNGIRVAMVDSGWFHHPFFEERGYRAAAVVLGPGTANPLDDELGHGTGESANLFAVAPDVELHPVKAQLSGTLNNVLVNATAAFNTAVALGPDIITCSWGSTSKTAPSVRPPKLSRPRLRQPWLLASSLCSLRETATSGSRASIRMSSRLEAFSFSPTDRWKRRIMRAASSATSTLTAECLTSPGWSACSLERNT